MYVFFFFFNYTATTEIYTLSLHDALPIYAYFHIADTIEDSSIEEISFEDAHRHNDLSLLDRFNDTCVILGVIAVAKSKVESVSEIRDRLTTALEHIDAMAMKPFQAYRNQDHRAHITAHMNFMATNFVRNNPPIMASLEKNIFEHISLMAQEHVELEFAQQIMEMKKAQAQGAGGPQMQQQMQELNLQMEARRSEERVEGKGLD